MKVFNFEETTFDIEKRQSIKVADWEVFPVGLHSHNKIAIRKITPNAKPNATTIKVFRVDDSDKYIFQVLKTKIKAQGGADGLVDWMIKDDGLMRCRIKQLLNFAWDNIRFEYL